MQTLVAFIEENDIQVLNVAGSRASRDPVLYDKVFKIMVGVAQVVSEFATTGWQDGFIKRSSGQTGNGTPPPGG